MEKGFWGKLKKPIIGVAPMDGVTDAAFRFITAKYGKPDLFITEFTSVEGICHGAIKPLSAFIYDPTERPIAAQIFGTDPESFYQASLLVCELGFDGIDINMGCPANTVASRGAGAALIQTPLLAQTIIRKCQQAAKDWANGKKLEESNLPKNIIEYVKTHLTSIPPRRILPVSVKTRIGYDKACAPEWVKYLLETEPANISLHGRTLKQMYEGQANWEEIAKASQIIHQTKTQVLGNGDIQSFEDAQNKIQQYGVDGVLIGRASFGNPWIFSSMANSSLKHPTTLNLENPSSASSEIITDLDFIIRKLQVAIEHSYYYQKTFNADYFAPMKKHLGWYCKGFPNAKEARQKLMGCNSASEVENATLSIIAELSTPKTLLEQS